MAKNLTLDELVAHFERKTLEAAAITEEAAMLTAPALAVAIQTTIGDQNELQPLADATIERKEQLGYADPPAPLYATGELRASVTPAAVDGVAMAGSSLEKSKWHEHGTLHVPPRPAFYIGLQKTLPMAVRIARRVVRRVMK